VLALFGGLSVWFELRSGQDRFPYVGFVILAFAVSLVIAGRRERRRQLQATLPLDITLTLDPPDPGPGDAFEVEASLQSLAALQVNRAALSLHAIAHEGDVRHTLHHHDTTLLNAAKKLEPAETYTPSLQRIKSRWLPSPDSLALYA